MLFASIFQILKRMCLDFFNNPIIQIWNSSETIWNSSGTPNLEQKSYKNLIKFILNLSMLGYLERLLQNSPVGQTDNFIAQDKWSTTVSATNSLAQFCQCAQMAFINNVTMSLYAFFVSNGCQINRLQKLWDWTVGGNSAPTLNRNYVRLFTCHFIWNFTRFWNFYLFYQLIIITCSKEINSTIYEFVRIFNRFNFVIERNLFNFNQPNVICKRWLIVLFVDNVFLGSVSSSTWLQIIRSN